ncbi:MAG: HsdR family type I site-specific deoxyribonuclease [Ignavibacteriales bacterium]|nr:HsdR family type I site-specific deoxyribonuclease [Ignavibacteriales bacterium]
MPHRGTETEFELTTIERIERLGYGYIHGEELDRPHEEVVLRDVLRRVLVKGYPDLPPRSIDEAVARFARPEGVDTLRRNMSFHNDLTRGIEVKVEHPNGKVEHRHLYAIDWDTPTNNEFLVVNQFPIHGKNDRRPDILIFINGLPLVLFELKNPYDKHPTVDHALNQIAHYRNDIAQLFDFNAVTVVSDGVTTLHGAWTSTSEWFAPWKSIDGFNTEANSTGSMKMLVEGMLPKDRLLSYIRDFLVFEVVNDKITKKGAKYHQFFAVRIAAQKAIESFRPDADKRIGVIWHTTGSGKSLSMVFLVGILRRHPEMQNPTFVIEVDRTDLDNQIHDQFVAARALVGDVKHADSVDDLRTMLQTEGGEVIFTTIEKFRLKSDEGEIEHPVLSNRSNLIIIADEAHRTQYGFLKGYARYLAEALPNARRMGFTGTPVSFSGSDTVEVFGDLIHWYDIKQSQADKATVPIFYAPRQIKLHLTSADIDAALQDIISRHPVDDLERRQAQWSALASAAGSKDRLDRLASDLLMHFLDRTATLKGKAIIVCMTRENCVRLYDALTVLPNCPEVKIVMTGDLSNDPPEWSAAGHITTKAQRDAIKQRMIDPDDPLKIVIVCDMWLTEPAPDVAEEAKPVFFECLEVVRKQLPTNVDYGSWRRLSRIELEDRFAAVFGHLTDTEERQDDFLQDELRLTQSYLLVKHLDECRRIADEIIFYQRVRNQLLKLSPGRKDKPELDQAVRDLVDDSLQTEGVVDIFNLSGIEKADISILDDKFLQTFKDKPFENLRVKLLEKLISDAIEFRQRGNLAKARSFKELLEATLRNYHNRLIDAAAVVKAMIQIRLEMENEDKRAAELGLEPEELAFYDAVAANYDNIYGVKFLRDLVHEVVLTIKRNLKVDWTEPHREDIKATIRSAVKRVLRNRGVKTEDFDKFVGEIMRQAEALYADWPLAA